MRDWEDVVVELQNGKPQAFTPNFLLPSWQGAREWKGMLPFDELPQVLNPKSNYVQNCNSSPFVTTDDGNPSRDGFPAYMFEDREEDKRRAKMSRKILREANDLTHGQIQELAFDTRIYWAMTELPRFKHDLSRMEKVDEARASEVRPYLEHLLDWDCRVTSDSTQACLCEAWYVELYGQGYPGETLRSEYQVDRLKRLDGLVTAATAMEKMHGNWQVPWGKIHRIQRTVNKAGVVEAATVFNDLFSSLPSLGAPGPLGVIFTQYSTPSIPLLRPKQYAVVGAAYLGAVEFGERVHGTSLTPYGQSSARNSPHYFDQAKLLLTKKMKTAWLYKEDVKQHAVRAYHPGQRRSEF